MNTSRLEINEQTMTQGGRQLFGRRNTLMGGAMGWTKVSKERMSGTEKAKAGIKRKENTKAGELLLYESILWPKS